MDMMRQGWPTISSTIVVRHGTSSSTSLGASCPSDCANVPTGSDQWDLVLIIGGQDYNGRFQEVPNGQTESCQHVCRGTFAAVETALRRTAKELTTQLSRLGGEIGP